MPASEEELAHHVQSVFSDLTEFGAREDEEGDDEPCILSEPGENGVSSVTAASRQLDSCRKLDRHPALVLNADYQVYLWWTFVVFLFLLLFHRSIRVPKLGHTVLTLLRSIFSNNSKHNKIASTNASTQHLVMAKYSQGSTLWQSRCCGYLP